MQLQVIKVTRAIVQLSVVKESFIKCTLRSEALRSFYLGRSKGLCSQGICSNLFFHLS